MKIFNKLYNNGCNTLMQYLMTISYQSFVPHRMLKLSLYYVTFALWHEQYICVENIKHMIFSLKNMILS